MWTLSFAAAPALAARISTVGFAPPGGFTGGSATFAMVPWLLVDIHVASDLSPSLSHRVAGLDGVGVQPVVATSELGNANVEGSVKQSAAGSVPPFAQLPCTHNGLVVPVDMRTTSPVVEVPLPADAGLKLRR